MIEQLWQRYLPTVRWFAGKGLAFEIPRITALPFVTPAGQWPAVRSEIATIDYGDRIAFCHLVVAYRPIGDPSAAGVIGRAHVPDLGVVDIEDATRDPDAVRALVVSLLDDRCPMMSWLDRSNLDPTAERWVLSGEQSNTSIAMGGTGLLKLFRTLEPGRNPDVEILAALSGSHLTPSLYGVLSAAFPEVAGTFDLGMVVQRVPDAVDGWTFATRACAADEDIAWRAAQVGRDLRSVHRLLAESFGTATMSGTALATRLLTRFDAARAHVPELAAVQQVAHTLYSGIAGLTLTSQRVHGDFHLGQVLRSDKGWTFIDFEGEPLESLAARRGFDSVWRDVAGMLRSFDYVRSAHPDPDAAAAIAWSRRAARSFLTGYSEDVEVDQTLLRAYEFDKAVYEVLYEVRNRPDWAHIPWRAVHDEARRILTGSRLPTDKEK